MSAAPATIFALASAPGRAGVAVVRISGSRAVQCLAALGVADAPPVRAAALRILRDGVTQQEIDRALVLRFAAPASFTGEDVAEVHLHGGKAVIDAVLGVLARLDGCRMAEPGEFTRRAFENGKLDLTAAEAVADLIAAETQAQRLQALDQLGGGLARLYTGWSERLAAIVAHIEADIEFPDEDLRDGISAALRPGIAALRDEVRAHLDDARRGERLRDGLQVAIIGAPNAGKSSLLNALAARDAAIVSDIAGTTRDVIEVPMDLGGYPVVFSDTAGLRATGDTIEAEGIRRATRRAQEADLKLALFDGALPPDAATLALVDARTIVVLTKSDVAQDDAPPQDAVFPPHHAVVRASVASVGGLGDLLHVLTAAVRDFFGARTAPLPTRERHRAALADALAHLDRAVSGVSLLPELIAEDLRLALRALGGITGRVHVEELLDRIFKDFCIGK